MDFNELKYWDPLKEEKPQKVAEDQPVSDRFHMRYNQIKFFSLPAVLTTPQ